MYIYRTYTLIQYSTIRQPVVVVVVVLCSNDKNTSLFIQSLTGPFILIILFLIVQGDSKLEDYSCVCGHQWSLISCGL